MASLIHQNGRTHYKRGGASTNSLVFSNLIDDPLPTGPVAPKYGKKKKDGPPMLFILYHQPVKIEMASVNKQSYSNNN